MSDKMSAGASVDAQEPGASQAVEAPGSTKPIPKKSRRFSPPIAALAVIAVIAVIAGLVWVRYTQSPQYSLGQLASAAQNKDWDGVQKYMDVDAVASHFLDAALSNARGDDSADDDSADDDTRMGDDTGMSGGTSGAGTTRTMGPAFIQRFRDALKKSIEDATLKSDAGGVSSVLLGKKPKSVTYVSKKEASATVEVPAGAGGTQDVTLRMQWADDHWRITALENVADLLGSLN